MFREIFWVLPQGVAGPFDRGRRAVGSPPGYVGYEEGGQLTEAVRRRPFASFHAARRTTSRASVAHATT